MDRHQIEAGRIRLFYFDADPDPDQFPALGFTRVRKSEFLLLLFSDSQLYHLTLFLSFSSAS